MFKTLEYHVPVLESVALRRLLLLTLVATSLIFVVAPI